MLQQSTYPDVHYMYYNISYMYIYIYTHIVYIDRIYIYIYTHNMCSVHAVVIFVWVSVVQSIWWTSIYIIYIYIHIVYTHMYVHACVYCMA